MTEDFSNQKNIIVIPTGKQNHPLTVTFRKATSAQN